MNTLEKLAAIQVELKAPKNQYNAFGKYKYRNAEGIVEALKPLQVKYKVSFSSSDEIVSIGNIIYIDTTAIMVDCETNETVERKGQAIIDFDAKGMQMPQRTGAASSYSKKYAYGNLLLIDDTKDSDAVNEHDKTATTSLPTLNKNSEAYKKAADYIKKGGSIAKVELKYTLTKEVKELLNTLK
jgi:hypothetical protein